MPACCSTSSPTARSSTCSSLVEYQVTDPDPVDQDNFPEESNAYGLTVLPNGDALVADAAANDIVRVTPDGVRHDGGPLRPADRRDRPPARHPRLRASPTRSPPRPCRRPSPSVPTGRSTSVS